MRILPEKGRALLRVTMNSGESTEKLVQRFKRTVAREGILKEIKKRRFYEKPSEARRRDMREQERVRRRKVLKEFRKKQQRSR